MSEYWKSTPKYWCKFCSEFVRDTPVSKRNHESTPRHQGSIQRSLRNLHKTHEREERDKSRAKAEVDRLNGIVGGGTSKSGAADDAKATGGASGAASNAAQARSLKEDLEEAGPEERKRRIAQLVALGVAVPNEYRKELAIAGDWETIASREVPQDRDTSDDVASFGVRKRKIEDGEDEDVAALEASTSADRKPERDTRAWGSRMKTWKKEDDDGELDIASLLTGPPQSVVEKHEAEDGADVKVEEDTDGLPTVKREGSDPTALLLPALEAAPVDVPIFKKRKNKAMKT